jgi:hypothetical protein
MTRAQKIWDFFLGVALISGAPLVALWAVSSVGSLAFHSVAVMPVVELSAWASSLIAFVVACFWRGKHRRLPSSLLVAEAMTAIFAAGLFMLAAAVIGYAAYRAD